MQPKQLTIWSNDQELDLKKVCRYVNVKNQLTNYPSVHWLRIFWCFLLEFVHIAQMFKKCIFKFFECISLQTFSLISLSPSRSSSTTNRQLFVPWKCCSFISFVLKMFTIASLFTFRRQPAKFNLFRLAHLFSFLLLFVYTCPKMVKYLYFNLLWMHGKRREKDAFLCNDALESMVFSAIF